MTDLADALNVRGMNLLDHGQIEEAFLLFERNSRAFPRDYRGFNNAGLVEFKRGKLRDAEYWHTQAWRRAEAAEVANNLGVTLTALGQWGNAEKWLHKAVTIDPELAQAWHALASIQLSDGRWTEGWANNRWRKTATPGYRAAPWPDGTEELSLLILRDFGIGDELFFLRWYADCQKRMHSVTYAPDLRLIPMLKRAGIDAVEGHPQTDLFCASVDVPFLLGMKTGDPVPPTIKLVPDQRRVNKWRARLEKMGPRPWVGVTWRSGTRNKASLFKEAPLPLLAAALSDFKGTVITIQRMEPELAPWSEIFEPDVSDIEEMLAVMALLDDYVCTSNTNLHMRHALGLSSRVLVPNPPDWRWFRSGDESAWFPGDTVYRQRPTGDWRTALDQLTRDMRHG